ncbi:MAG TPA: hypothetical protein VG652_02450 [Gaiellaceae bacterium]|nr:hypothetical protein [Gaiellaceae bacterium]
MFRRPGPRFVLWVVLLVGVAAVAGVDHLAWWLIALIEFAAWAVVAVVERSLSRPDHLSTLSTLPLPSAPLPFEDLSYVRVLGANAGAPDPEPLPDPAPPASDLWATREPVEAPVLAPVAVAAAPPSEDKPERRSGLISRPFRSVAGGRAEQTVSRRGRTFGGQPVQWNIWNLERIAREQAGDNDELGFIVTYLRDYASPEGLLPLNFDSLVRESFGDLLGYATV